MDELRLAIRRLTKRPGASLVSIVTLACAIGAAAATWSLLSAVLLRPVPVKDADRLVVAGTVMPSGRLAGMVVEGFVYPRFAVVRDSGIFEHVSAEWSSPPSFLTSTGTNELPVPANIGFVTFGYFDLLGLQVPLGRGFNRADDRRGAGPVAILTDAYWRRTFDGRADVVGRTITVQGKAVTIIGVAPAGFRGVALSRPMDFYLPFHTIADIDPGSMNYFAEPGHTSSPTAGTTIIARLLPGARVDQALARLSGLDAPGAGAGTKPVYRLTPINLSAIPYSARAGMSQFARLLGSTVALLLLIGGGTVGMLLLIRTEARREELALCVALGASRGRLACGIVMEGSILAAAGALLAVPVSWWVVSVRPALRAARVDLGTVLKDQ